MSSIFMMLLTVSVASLTAEEDTSRGCTTFSSRMSVMVPCMGEGSCDEKGVSVLMWWVW